MKIDFQQVTFSASCVESIESYTSLKSNKAELLYIGLLYLDTKYLGAVVINALMIYDLPSILIGQSLFTAVRDILSDSAMLCPDI